MSFCMTTCPYCSCGCGVLLRAEGGRLQGSCPLSSHPVSKGSLCMRGWNCTQAPYHPERLARAQIRRGGALAPVSPEDAVAEIAGRLSRPPAGRARESSGAPILFVIGPTLANEDVLASCRLAELLDAQVCGAELSTVQVARRAMRTVTGNGYASQNPDLLETADLIWVFGADTDNFPQLASRLVQAGRRGARFVQFDVFSRSKLGRNALSVTVPPAGFALLPLLLQKAAIDLERVPPAVKSARGFSNFSDHLRRTAPFLSELPQLNAGRLEELAGELLDALRPAAVIGERWLSSYDGARRTTQLLQALALLGVEDRVVIAAGEAGSWGASDVLREGSSEGPAPLLEFLTAGNDRIPAAVIIIGDDLVRRNPAFEEKLKQAGLVVVIDRFESDTLPYAHAVLPTCAFGEAEGTVTNTFGHVQKWERAVSPPGDACPERVWMARIGRRMGLGDWPERQDEWLRELEAEVPGYENIGLENLFAVDGPSGIPAKKTGSLAFAHCGVPAPVLEPDGFSLRLFFSSHPADWSSGALSRREELLKREAVDSEIHASPADIKKAGLKPGEMVKVATPHSTAHLTLREDARLPEGVLLAIPLSGSQAGTLRGFYPDPSGQTLGVQPVPAKLGKG